MNKLLADDWRFVNTQRKAALSADLLLGDKARGAREGPAGVPQRRCPLAFASRSWRGSRFCGRVARNTPTSTKPAYPIEGSHCLPIRLAARGPDSGRPPVRKGIDRSAIKNAWEGHRWCRSRGLCSGTGGLINLAIDNAPLSSLAGRRPPARSWTAVAPSSERRRKIRHKLHSG
jgi:hypothetical protein